MGPPAGNYWSKQVAGVSSEGQSTGGMGVMRVPSGSRV